MVSGLNQCKNGWKHSNRNREATTSKPKAFDDLKLGLRSLVAPESACVAHEEGRLSNKHGCSGTNSQRVPTERAAEGTVVVSILPSP